VKRVLSTAAAVMLLALGVVQAEVVTRTAVMYDGHLLVDTNGYLITVEGMNSWFLARPSWDTNQYVFIFDGQTNAAGMLLDSSGYGHIATNETGPIGGVVFTNAIGDKGRMWDWPCGYFTDQVGAGNDYVPDPGKGLYRVGDTGVHFNVVATNQSVLTGDYTMGAWYYGLGATGSGQPMYQTYVCATNSYGLLCTAWWWRYGYAGHLDINNKFERPSSALVVAHTNLVNEYACRYVVVVRRAGTARLYQDAIEIGSGDVVAGTNITAVYLNDSTAANISGLRSGYLYRPYLLPYAQSVSDIALTYTNTRPLINPP